MSNRVFAIGAIVLVVALIVGGAVILIANGSKKSGTTGTTTQSSGAVTLTMWGTFDDPSAFTQIIDSYKQDHPNVTINYVKKDVADYEVQSLNALAAGTGPDIWSINKDWMPRHQNKIVPLPDNYYKANVKSETRSNEDYYNATWPAITAATNVIDHKVYGLPLYIDTLGLYINSDLWSAARAQYQRDNVNNPNFDDALFRTPPATWNDLLDELKYLTKKDAKGNITQAGIALGTSNNISASADILSLLMLQNGTTMVDQGQKSARFNTFQSDASGKPVYNGTNALDFYTSFARPDKSNYAWNASQPDALSAFISGKLAIMVGYQFLTQNIKQLAPTLNYQISGMPQVKGGKTVNYSSFWTETVTNNSRNPDAAWSFLNFLAARPITYLQVTKRPSARLIDIQSNPSEAFGIQPLTAQTWYKGTESEKVDQIFNDMIDNVVDKNQPLQSTIDAGATNVSNLLLKE